MSVRLYNPDGTVNAGEDVISPEMREGADRIGGWVEDTETGEVIYDGRKG